MRKEIYDDGDIAIFYEGDKYFIRYDSGSHQIAIREDEISEQEAMQAMENIDKATQVLFALQKRLSLAGVNPYESNI